MISYEDVLSFNYYTYGQPFTGSYQGMRYRLIRQKAVTNEDGETVTQEGIVVTIWPEPFSFEKTEDALKQNRLFPFNEEGKAMAVDWLNESYETGRYKA